MSLRHFADQVRLALRGLEGDVIHTAPGTGSYPVHRHLEPLELIVISSPETEKRYIPGNAVFGGCARVVPRDVVYPLWHNGVPQSVRQDALEVAAIDGDNRHKPAVIHLDGTLRLRECLHLGQEVFNEFLNRSRLRGRKIAQRANQLPQGSLLVGPELVLLLLVLHDLVEGFRGQPLKELLQLTPDIDLIVRQLFSVGFEEGESRRVRLLGLQETMVELGQYNQQLVTEGLSEEVGREGGNCLQESAGQGHGTVNDKGPAVL